MSLALGALGTLARARETGVKTMNAEVDGKAVALAIIENARFDRDPQGYTTLEEGKPK
jgi:hypothetical protein